MAATTRSLMPADSSPVDALQPALKVRLIGKSNGVGLSRDFELLAAALAACGCGVPQQGGGRRDPKRRRSLLTRLTMRWARWRGAQPPPAFDVNIMLEHVWPQFVLQARCNVLVPNPEWFDRRDVAMLAIADRIWAKTAFAEQLFVARGCRVLRIGFDSDDRLQPAVLRQPQFLHLAGRSPLKGTQRLLARCQPHPQGPQLTVVQDTRAGMAAAKPAAANIVHARGFLSDQDLR